MALPSSARRPKRRAGVPTEEMTQHQSLALQGVLAPHVHANFKPLEGLGSKDPSVLSDQVVRGTTIFRPKMRIPAHQCVSLSVGTLNSRQTFTTQAEHGALSRTSADACCSSCASVSSITVSSLSGSFGAAAAAAAGTVGAAATAFGAATT